LSYTNFNYHNIKVSSNKISKNESISVSGLVTNLGKVKIDEIVIIIDYHNHLPRNEMAEKGEVSLVKELKN
jgi:hypothetical protein